MSANTTIPSVIDALLAVLRGLAACAPPVVVFDGLPGTSLPDTFVAVGGAVTPVEEGEQDWGGLGGPPRVTYEHYEVDVTISALVGGDDAGGASGADDAQKTARDAVFAIFNPFNIALKNDPALNGQNGGPPLLLWCLPAKLALRQTTPIDPEAGKGRHAELNLKVLVKARLQ